MADLSCSRPTASSSSGSANLLQRIGELLRANGTRRRAARAVEVGSRGRPLAAPPRPVAARRARAARDGLVVGARVNPEFTFDTFVEGKSNQLAKAAARQVADNPGRAYNPLFMYGGVGLGKTHLMHAVANYQASATGGARRLRAFGALRQRHGARAPAQYDRRFQAAYRTLDALLIDDIQFFAGKERSQEEFFHTFNALLEGQQQVILTCDRYPKEVEGLEERLKSRFGWGLTVAIEPPELETCVAILMTKAQAAGRAAGGSGVLHRQAHPLQRPRARGRAAARDGQRALHRPAITLDFAKEALSDLLALQEKLVTVENIQKTVAEYYKIRVADLLSKRRSRSIARPRQLAMALAKELTNHSLPEIGDAFGGRDHTTVLHACRRIKELREVERRMGEDFSNLLRTLTN